MSAKYITNGNENSITNIEAYGRCFLQGLDLYHR